MKKRIIIGRDYGSCDLLVDQRYDTVSNNHAVITLEENRYVFTDNSSNGTIINGTKIHNRSIPIVPGDTILLAGVYPLKWKDIQELLPLPIKIDNDGNPSQQHVSRPTVERNIHGGWGRGTVPMGDKRQSMDMATGSKVSSATNIQERGINPQEEMPNGQHSSLNMNNIIPENRTPENNKFQKTNETGNEIEGYLRKWNWGAFFLTFYWGLFHKVWSVLGLIGISLLSLATYILNPSWYWFIYGGVFVLSLIFSAYYGANGSRLAYEKLGKPDFEKFKKCQRGWSIAGFIILGVSILLSILSIVFLKVNSDGYLNNGDVQDTTIVVKDTTSVETKDEVEKNKTSSKPNNKPSSNKKAVESQQKMKKEKTKKRSEEYYDYGVDSVAEW